MVTISTKSTCVCTGSIQVPWQPETWAFERMVRLVQVAFKHPCSRPAPVISIFGLSVCLFSALPGHSHGGVIRCTGYGGRVASRARFAGSDRSHGSRAATAAFFHCFTMSLLAPAFSIRDAGISTCSRCVCLVHWSHAFWTGVQAALIFLVDLLLWARLCFNCSSGSKASS